PGAGRRRPARPERPLPRLRPAGRAPGGRHRHRRRLGGACPGRSGHLGGGRGHRGRGGGPPGGLLGGPRPPPAAGRRGGGGARAAGGDERRVRTWGRVAPGARAGEVREIRYPAAGTANAEVRLVIADLDGGVLPVRWDSAAFPYLAAARWQRDEPLIAVQDRAQTECSVLAVDPGRGECRVLPSQRDARWVDLVAGTPAQTGSGDLVCTADAGGTRSLLVGGRAVTPPGLQVVAVFDVDGEDVLFAGSAEPTEIGVWRHSPAGLTRLSPAGAVGQGRLRAGTVVLGTEALQAVGPARAVPRDRAPTAPGGSPPRPPT